MRSTLSFSLLFTAVLFLCSCHKTDATSARVQSVILNKQTISILAGATETLAAVVLPADAQDTSVVWSSSDPTIATVSARGVVTTLNGGAATITVTTKDGNHTATCAVTVSNSVVAVTGVSLSRPTATLQEGTTLKLIATIAPADATNQEVVWTTSDPTRVTVSAEGLVTAVADGTATITVTTQEGNHTATCAVTVSNSVVAVTGVSLSRHTATLQEGTTLKLIATIAPADATNQEVVWTTSDLTRVTVSAEGLVTAVAGGTATITVTTQEGNHTATCTVTIVNYIEINGLKWATGNLIATNATSGGVEMGTGVKIGNPEDGGLYFQFGSLIGYKGGSVASGGRGVGQVSYKSLDYWGGAPSFNFVNEAMVWPSVMATDPGETWPFRTDNKWFFGYNKDGYGDIFPPKDPKEFPGYSTGELAVSGVGDPCTYYLGGDWRQPTLEEVVKLVETGYSGPNYQTLNGSLGYYLGPGAGTQDLAASCFYPASGSRRHGVKGAFGITNVYGYYWTASITNRTNGYHLFFESGALPTRQMLYRSDALPVRCVSQ